MRIKGISGKVMNSTGMLRGPAVTGAIGRICPVCEAAPGFPCVRPRGARVRGEDIGGSYMVRLKNFHRPRRKEQRNTVIIHDLEYRAGTLGLRDIPDDTPHWSCTCGHWRYEAKPMPYRKTGNNQTEATRAHQRHTFEVMW